MILFSWFTSFFIGLGYIHAWIYPDKMKTTFSPVLVLVSLELSPVLVLVLELSPVLVLVLPALLLLSPLVLVALLTGHSLSA
jgi:hypothetical protein